MSKKLHALIQDGIVRETRRLSDDEVYQLSLSYQNVIDVSEFDGLNFEGASWNGSNFIDSNGNALSPVSQITRLGFRQRFNLNEMVAIQLATASDVVLQVLMDNLKVATFIDLRRQDTIQGVFYLAQANLITMQRAQEILYAPVQEHERFRGV